MAVTGSTWISIIVIKHAASMNYLFVGTPEYMRRMERKKRKQKEELESVEKKKKHVSESIIKAVKCLRPFPAGYWVHSAKDRKQERDRERERERETRKAEGNGGGSSSLFLVSSRREPASTFAYYAGL